MFIISLSCISLQKESINTSDCQGDYLHNSTEEDELLENFEGYYDMDCDGIPAKEDCDDNDPSTVYDMDCDGIPTLEDCNDNDPSNLNDMDCDGILTVDDCDDNNSDIGTIYEDYDCDGVLTADDCDDNNILLQDISEDNDCDGVLTEDDCDDTNNLLLDKAQDRDCDGVLAIDDCDDINSNIGSIDEDNDCDGILTIDDCDDNDELKPNNDTDCDGVLTLDDCDDNDESKPNNDADCDGIHTNQDCDDYDASTVTDMDCDGFVASEDCDDNDASLNYTDFDGDGYYTCHYETEKCIILIMTDSYGDGWNNALLVTHLDGQYFNSYTFNNGYSQAESICFTGEITFTYISGVYEFEVSYEIIDENGSLLFSDGPNPQTGEIFSIESSIIDCDDHDSQSVLSTSDGDCDGVLTIDDCDDHNASSTIVSEDNDCDGIVTDEDCNDNDILSTVVSEDNDCDGVVTSEDCNDNDASLSTCEVFAIFQSGSTYSQASNHCNSLGGHLAWIHNATENYLAYELCNSHSTPDNWGCLLGIQRSNSGGFTHWDNGDSLAYTPILNVHDGQSDLYIYNSLVWPNRAMQWEDGEQVNMLFPYLCRLPNSALLSQSLGFIPIEQP